MKKVGIGNFDGVQKFESSEIKGNKKVKTLSTNGGKTVAVLCLKK